MPTTLSPIVRLQLEQLKAIFNDYLGQICHENVPIEVQQQALNAVLLPTHEETYDLYKNLFVEYNIVPFVDALRDIFSNRLVLQGSVEFISSNHRLSVMMELGHDEESQEVRRLIIMMLGDVLTEKASSLVNLPDQFGLLDLQEMIEKMPESPPKKSLKTLIERLQKACGEDEDLHQAIDRLIRAKCVEPHNLSIIKKIHEPAQVTKKGLIIPSDFIYLQKQTSLLERILNGCDKLAMLNQLKKTMGTQRRLYQGLENVTERGTADMSRLMDQAVNQIQSIQAINTYSGLIKEQPFTLIYNENEQKWSLFIDNYSEFRGEYDIDSISGLKELLKQRLELLELYNKLKTESELLTANHAPARSMLDPDLLAANLDPNRFGDANVDPLQDQVESFKEVESQLHQNENNIVNIIHALPAQRLLPMTSQQLESGVYLGLCGSITNMCSLLLASDPECARFFSLILFENIGNLFMKMNPELSKKLQILATVRLENLEYLTEEQRNNLFYDEFEKIQPEILSKLRAELILNAFSQTVRDIQSKFDKGKKLEFGMKGGAIGIGLCVSSLLALAAANPAPTSPAVMVSQGVRFMTHFGFIVGVGEGLRIGGWRWQLGGMEEMMVDAEGPMALRPVIGALLGGLLGGPLGVILGDVAGTLLERFLSPMSMIPLLTGVGSFIGASIWYIFMPLYAVAVNENVVGLAMKKYIGINKDQIKIIQERVMPLLLGLDHALRPLQEGLHYSKLSIPKGVIKKTMQQQLFKQDEHKDENANASSSSSQQQKITWPNPKKTT